MSYAPLQHKIAIKLSICIVVVLAYRWMQEIALVQTPLLFFNNRMDITTFLFQQWGWHQFILQQPQWQLIADLAFYLPPILTIFAAFRFPNYTPWMALLWWIGAFSYSQTLPLYPIHSMEAYLGWITIPFWWMCWRNEKLQMHLWLILRYWFLFLFVSAAVWKIRMGAISYPAHFSHVLVRQHAALIAQSPDHWFSQFIGWLKDHSRVAQGLFLLAVLIQFSFVIGFFTTKADKILFFNCCLFLAADFFLMRIPYFDWLPLAVLFSGSGQIIEYRAKRSS